MILSQQKTAKSQLYRAKDPKAILKFTEWLDQIYLEQATFKQLIMNNQYTEFFLPSGQAYNILRQKMKHICNIARHLINNSIAAIFKNDQPSSKQMQAAIKIFSDHFQNIMSANKQVCLLWQTNFSRPILKQQILNQHTLRQLIPNNLNVPFRKFFEFMPKMFQKTGGQKIKILHTYISQIFQSVQKKEFTELRQEMNKKCEKWKKQIQTLTGVKMNLEKAIEDSEFFQSENKTQEPQIRLQRVQSQTVQTSKNKKSKKRKNKNKKKKKKTHSLDAESQNQFDDLPELLAIQKIELLTRRKKFFAQHGTKEAKQNQREINSLLSILIKDQSNKIDHDREDLWNHYEIQLLTYIQNFYIQPDGRAQCNLAPQYVQKLQKQTEQLKKHFKSHNK